MSFSKTFRTAPEFHAAWPRIVEAIVRLHENSMVLPDYRFELSESELKRVRSDARIDIEKALRKFWMLDERFHGDAIFDAGDSFRWSVYSIVYLAEDETVAEDLLNVYAPLLGRYALMEFGLVFARKVCATLRSDVEHLIWDIQGARSAEFQGFFDWRGHLNELSPLRRAELLAITGLPVLKDPDIPPREVMRGFCFSVDHAQVTRSYRRDLKRFYDGDW